MTLLLERKAQDTKLHVVNNANWKKPVYETSALNVWYGSAHALKNINFSIPL